MNARTDTVESNKQRLRRVPEEIFDGGDLDLVDELFADEFVGHAPPVPGELRGPDEFEGLVTAFRTGFPDLAHTEVHLVGEGDVVVARVTGTGAHDGEFLGVPPTGETIETTAMEMYRFDDGRIVEAWLNVDTLGLLQQIGAVEGV